MIMIVGWQIMVNLLALMIYSHKLNKLVAFKAEIIIVIIKLTSAVIKSCSVLCSHFNEQANGR